MAGNVAAKKASLGNFILYISLFIVLLILNGFMNFVAASFTLGVILTATYWLKTVTGSMSALGAFIIFAFLRRDTKLINDPIYNEKLVAVNGTVSGNVGPDFPEFIAMKNENSKSLKWREKMQNKLTKWGNKVPARVLKNIKKIKDNPEWPDKSKWVKFKRLHRLYWTLCGQIRWFFAKRRANRWTAKRDKILLQLTDVWILENIHYIKVKYPETTPGEIMNGERNTSTGKVIDNGAIKHILQDRLPLILVITMLQMAFNALVIIGATNPVGMWMAVVFQLATILLNVGTGLHYGNKLFIVLDMNNLTTREQYLMEYLIWKKAVKSAILEA
jgi:hypothetical protein